MLCKHNWELIDKTILESAFEQMKKADVREIGNASGSMFRKKLVYMFQCSKCTKTKKSVETNP